VPSGGQLKAWSGGGGGRCHRPGDSSERKKRVHKQSEVSVSNRPGRSGNLDREQPSEGEWRSGKSRLLVTDASLSEKCDLDGKKKKKHIRPPVVKNTENA